MSPKKKIPKRVALYPFTRKIKNYVNQTKGEEMTPVTMTRESDKTQYEIWPCSEHCHIYKYKLSH